MGSGSLSGNTISIINKKKIFFSSGFDIFGVRGVLDIDGDIYDNFICIEGEPITLGPFFFTCHRHPHPPPPPRTKIKVSDNKFYLFTTFIGTDFHSTSLLVWIHDFLTL